MALAGSGDLHLGSNTGGTTRCIRYEILSAYGSYSLTTANTATSQGLDMTDYYSYSHVTYGTMYGQTFHQGPGSPANIKRITHGGLYFPTATEAIMFAATQNEDTKATADSGIDYIVTDNAGAIIYRRLKGTSDSWITAQSWIVSYQSETYSCDFTTYDYKWYIDDA